MEDGVWGLKVEGGWMEMVGGWRWWVGGDGGWVEVVGGWR